MMVIVEHPNGCVHKIPEELRDKFIAAGWKEKAAHTESPDSPPKRKRKK